MRTTGLVGLAVALAFFVAASDASIHYRWAYRNPLSIVYPDAVDLGIGSYNGTVNSPQNQAPGATPILRYSHGATTAFLPNGSLAVIWQGSPLWWEGNLQQAAYWALSNDGGESFGPATLIYSSATGPIWGPTIHVDNGTLYMMYSGTAPSACQYEGEGGLAFPPGGDLVMVASTDNGATWSEPTIMLPVFTDGMSAKLNIGKIELDGNGTWLVPFWRETSGPNCWGKGTALNGVPGILASSDKGKTWVERTNQIPPAAGAPPTEWLIENIVVRINSTSMLQTFRSNTSTVWQSISRDDGLTWSPAAPGPVTAPNTKTDMAVLPDGSVVMAFNNATRVRTNLTISRSTDSGRTWSPLVVLETSNASFSYPTVTYHPEIASLSVVYSVWQWPNSKPVAPLSPRGSRAASAPGTSGAAVVPLPRTVTAGRRLLGGRALQQVPYNVGAWGRVSYGIRMATIPLADLLPASI